MWSMLSWSWWQCLPVCLRVDLSGHALRALSREHESIGALMRFCVSLNCLLQVVRSLESNFE